MARKRNRLARRRRGHAAMATVEKTAGDVLKSAKDHPILTGASVGATAGMVAGAAGVIPGIVIGAAGGVAVERLVKG